MPATLDPKVPKIKAVVVRGSYSEVTGFEKDTGVAIRRDVYPSTDGDYSKAVVQVTEEQLASAHGVLVRWEDLNSELVRVKAESTRSDTPSAEAVAPPAGEARSRGRARTTDAE